MAADASQNPGTLNLGFRRGETYSEVIDVSIDMTGYTVTSELVSLVTGLVVAPVTTSFVNAAAGQVSISFTSTETNVLAA